MVMLLGLARRQRAKSRKYQDFTGVTVAERRIRWPRDEPVAVLRDEDGVLCSECFAGEHPLLDVKLRRVEDRRIWHLLESWVEYLPAVLVRTAHVVRLRDEGVPGVAQ